VRFSTVKGVAVMKNSLGESQRMTKSEARVRIRNLLKAGWKVELAG
jgi:hypothetical protein